MINDINLTQQSYSGDNNTTTKDNLPNKTSYFGFKMTMSNAVSENGGKQESEYSNIDSPIIPTKNELKLVIQQNSESYSEESKKMSDITQTTNTINHEIEDSAGSAPMPIMNKLKIPA